ncbi:Metacaspase-9 [Heracleum sosnowskyi]|uniref:Metacaspase-9 n=1 Tax=Heracleum sosnowskyi TaxID=360622 RepID=A0AAD8J4B6_9APIA|nr:Metacaspase-9 [Heracleum sosnowskyi]
MAEGNMKRMAVLAGCNYPNTPNELHGCINDVLTMQNTLITRFGFDPTDIELLTDAPDSTLLPTGENIKKALGKMIDEAASGDVLFFHYSGHGTRIPSVKSHRPFWKDEAIVPCDLNLITDMDFRELVNRLPEGASFTIISDSCHSGGLIDKEKEQIGPATVPEKRALHIEQKPKTLPFETILQQLSSVTNINTSDIGTHLLEFFGSNASLKFLSPQDEQESVHPDAGILLSGCQANETSADISSSGGGKKKAYGAFSNAVQMVLKENSGALSNKEIVMLARNVLLGQLVLGQHPCLYCSDENASKPFLCQPLESSSDII